MSLPDRPATPDLAQLLRGPDSTLAHRVVTAVDAVCSIIVTDRSGHILWVNAGFERLNGYPLSEIVGRKPGDFLQGPATDPAAIATMQAGIASGEGFFVEILNYTRSRDPLWVSIHCLPHCDREGRTVGFTAIQTDISAQKRAELALEADRARLRTIIDCTPGIVWEADAETFRFTFVSESAERLLGYPADAWIADPRFWVEHLHPEDRLHNDKLTSTPTTI